MWAAVVLATLLLHGTRVGALEAVELRATSSLACNAFVPGAGMPSSNPTEVLCGRDWLVQLLGQYNQTVLDRFLKQTGDMVRVLDFACALPPQPDCKTCAERFWQFYEHVGEPASNCERRSAASMQDSKYKDAAYNIGRDCIVTNNPFQVFHPLPVISSNCYLCVRAFMNQYACSNKECNDAFGLSWWPFYPLPPNSNYPGAVGEAAGDWGVDKVCECFTKEYKTPLSDDDIDELGVCLWVIYQSDPPGRHGAITAA